MSTVRSVAGLIAAGASLALAGCGGGAKSATPKGPVERHIFVSAVDCEASGKFNFEECSKSIEAAIGAHEKNAPTYKSQTGCEEKEGQNRCERAGEQVYRPRLAAFVFDTEKPVSAKPLYPTLDGAHGFRQDKTVLLGKDENLLFSKSARDAYELLAGSGRKRRG